MTDAERAATVCAWVARLGIPAPRPPLPPPTPARAIVVRGLLVIVQHVHPQRVKP